MPLRGDCQTNWQDSGFGTVGVGDGVGDGTVGVGDSIGSGIAGGVSVGVAEGIGVVVGLGVSVSVGMAVLEGDGVGVPIRAANGADSAAQAISESVRPVKRNAFLIVVLAFYSLRIAFSSRGVLRTDDQACSHQGENLCL